MTKIITLSLLLLSGAAFAQTTSNSSTTTTTTTTSKSTIQAVPAESFNTHLVGNYNGGGMWLPPTVARNVVEGSTYMFPNWTGVYKVITKDGNSHQLFNLNYNILTKKVEAMVSKDSVFQYDLNVFDYIIPSLTKVKFKIIDSPQLKGMVQEVFKNDKIAFYKETTVKLENGVVNPLTQSMLQEDAYVKNVVYHIQKNGVYEKVKLSKGSILGQLADKKESVTAYVKSNKLSYSTENDVVAILRHYATL